VFCWRSTRSVAGPGRTGRRIECSPRRPPRRSRPDRRSTADKRRRATDRADQANGRRQHAGKPYWRCSRSATQARRFTLQALAHFRKQQGATYDDLNRGGQHCGGTRSSTVFRSDTTCAGRRRRMDRAPTDAWINLAGLARETSRLRSRTLDGEHVPDARANCDLGGEV